MSVTLIRFRSVHCPLQLCRHIFTPLDKTGDDIKYKSQSIQGRVLIILSEKVNHNTNKTTQHLYNRKDIAKKSGKILDKIYDFYHI